jgi:hypothetical protein
MSCPQVFEQGLRIEDVRTGASGSGGSRGRTAGDSHFFSGIGRAAKEPGVAAVIHRAVMKE